MAAAMGVIGGLILLPIQTRRGFHPDMKAVPGYTLDFNQLVELVSEDERLGAQFRFGSDRSRFQAGFLRRIKRARLELEVTLARSDPE